MRRRKNRTRRYLKNKTVFVNFQEGVCRMKSILRCLVKTLFAVRLIQFEKLVSRGPSILLPHHISFWAALFLYLFLPENACFVASREVVRKHGFLGRMRLILRFARLTAVH